MRLMLTKLAFGAGMLAVAGTASAGKPAAKAPPPELVAKGAELFRTRACNSCHLADGKAGPGPSLAKVYGKQVTLRDGTQVVADEAYLRESITAPNAKIVKGYLPQMPVMVRSPEEVDALVAYLQTLK